MRRLIINADDLGINPARSHGIFQCFEQGVVRSASLIPNGSHSDQAAKWARERELSCGLHVNLTEDFPLSKVSDIETLVKASGMFHEPQELRRLLDNGEVDRVHIEREIRTQMEWFLDKYGQPSHVNGHTGIHVHPVIVPIIIPILERYAVRFTRIRNEQPLPPFGYVITEKEVEQARIIGEEAEAARPLYKAHGIESTDHFRGLTLHGNASKKNLRHILSRLPEGTTELMVHPGSQAAYGTPFDLDPQRQTELNMLTDETLPEQFKQLDITLCSFEDL
jgi:predicted glycoside hydrolase/deacetylase ChbG (UPF0249 family)